MSRKAVGNTIIFVMMSFAIMVQPGCSAETRQDDAGIQDGGPDGRDDDGGLQTDLDGRQDAGSDEDEDAWILIFPQGLRVCEWNSLRTQLPPNGGPESKIRFGLKDVSLRWPQEQESLEVDLVDWVEVALDGARAEPWGPGLLQTSRYQDTPGTWVSFRYTQDHRLGARHFQVSFSFHIVLPLQDKRIDVSTLLTKEFNNCEVREGQVQGTVLAEAENSDRVEVDYFYALSFLCMPGLACLTPWGVGDVLQGRFIRGTDERVIDSYFRVGLDCMHHGGPNQFLMFFTEPLGDIHGVVLKPGMYGGGPYQLDYLDENLTTSATETITDIQWDDPGRTP